MQIAVCVLCTLSQWLSGGTTLFKRKIHSLMRIQDGCFRRKLPVALTAVLTALRKGSCNQGFSATHPPFMRFQANPGLRFMRFYPNGFRAEPPYSNAKKRQGYTEVHTCLSCRFLTKSISQGKPYLLLLCHNQRLEYQIR